MILHDTDDTTSYDTDDTSHIITTTLKVIQVVSNDNEGVLYKNENCLFSSISISCLYCSCKGRFEILGFCFFYFAIGKYPTFLLPYSRQCFLFIIYHNIHSSSFINRETYSITLFYLLTYTHWTLCNLYYTVFSNPILLLVSNKFIIILLIADFILLIGSYFAQGL